MATTMNNRSLKRVREQRHLNITDVADFTKISVARLALFEEGDLRPSRKQLDKLARTYGVPIYSLFGDAIPNIAEALPDFRRRQPTSAVLSPRGLRSILTSESISRFTKQLLIETKYEAPEWASSAKIIRADQKGARELRSQFDAWLSKRRTFLELSGTPEQQFTTALRLFFEAQGGSININAAPAEDYLGYFIEPDGGAPTIFVNRIISSKKAQLFTLVHEYAHALLSAPGISNPFVVQNATERACNIFAAEFLAPLEQFTKLAKAVPLSLRQDIFQYVAILSGQLLLSKHATAIRLKETDFITSDDLRQFEDAWKEFPAKEKEEDAYDASTGGVPHAKRLSELGYLPIYLAAQAVEARTIDSIDVQAAIGLSEALQKRAFDLAKRRMGAAR